MREGQVVILAATRQEALNMRVCSFNAPRPTAAPNKTVLRLHCPCCTGHRCAAANPALLSSPASQTSGARCSMTHRYSRREPSCTMAGKRQLIAKGAMTVKTAGVQCTINNFARGAINVKTAGVQCTGAQCSLGDAGAQAVQQRPEHPHPAQQGAAGLPCAQAKPSGAAGAKQQSRTCTLLAASLRSLAWAAISPTWRGGKSLRQDAKGFKVTHRC